VSAGAPRPATEAPLAREVFGVVFQNPVLLAAGTAGMGLEVERVTDLEALGGLVTKSVSVEPRAGNPAPRVADAPGAMLNSVGLANPGLEVFRSEILPRLATRIHRARILVSVVGRTVDDFVTVVRSLADAPGIVAFELNVSCPNVAAGGVEFGADADVLAELVRRTRDATSRPLVVKLSPAVAEPARLAVRAAEAGADGFTAINTLPALLFENGSAAPRLGNGTGGLSGPPLLPVGVRITRLVSQATGRPVIGTGGIRTARDAMQYLVAGASLVGVGTAALADPRVPERIARDLAPLLRANGGG